MCIGTYPICPHTIVLTSTCRLFLNRPKVLWIERKIKHSITAFFQLYQKTNYYLLHCFNEKALSWCLLFGPGLETRLTRLELHHCWISLGELQCWSDSLCVLNRDRLACLMLEKKLCHYFPWKFFFLVSKVWLLYPTDANHVIAIYDWCFTQCR